MNAEYKDLEKYEGHEVRLTIEWWEASRGFYLVGRGDSDAYFAVRVSDDASLIPEATDVVKNILAKLTGGPRYVPEIRSIDGELLKQCIEHPDGTREFVGGEQA